MKGSQALRSNTPSTSSRVSVAGSSRQGGVSPASISRPRSSTPTRVVGGKTPSVKQINNYDTVVKHTGSVAHMMRSGLTASASTKMECKVTLKR